MTEDLETRLIEQLKRYLENAQYPEHGLTVKKLSDREVDYRVEDGKLVFSMDRHHPVACRYVKGFPMEAFVETKETYIFDSITKAIDNCGSEFVRVEADYDRWADSQLEDFKPTVTRISSRRFSYHPAWGDETVVTSYRQVAELVEDEVLNWDLDALLSEFKEHMSQQEVDAVVNKLMEACVKKALNNFRAEWDAMLAEDSPPQKTASATKTKRKAKKA